MALYASRADLLAALSLDSQAKLSTDTARRWTVGTADGTKTKFSTPFVEVTTLKAFLDGTEVVSPAPTLSRGTGTGGRDEVVFATAPAAGKVVSVSADAGAVNADVLDSVLASVSAQIDGYLYAVLPVTDVALLESLKGKAVLLARVRLRGRRNLDVVDPIEMEWKAAMRWLELVAEGKIPLASGSVGTAPDGSDGDFAYGSFDPIFATDEEMP